MTPAVSELPACIADITSVRPAGCGQATDRQADT
jgi:hypothetical protein